MYMSYLQYVIAVGYVRSGRWFRNTKELRKENLCNVYTSTV